MTRTCPIHGPVTPIPDTIICPRPNCRRDTEAAYAPLPRHLDLEDQWRMPDVRERQAKDRSHEQ